MADDKNLALEELKRRGIDAYGSDAPLWLQRIANYQDYPVLLNPEGTHSTHSMMWGESDGKYVVFPTVVMQGDSLVRLNPQDALRHAAQTNSLLRFDTPEEAQSFSKSEGAFNWKTPALTGFSRDLERQLRAKQGEQQPMPQEEADVMEFFQQFGRNF